ncbi:glycoside hydrolase family 32 protein [candidate division KSB1 bacterium]|nr:glycoside hydrolase family 32 protein [candidate division KSB1 bacterium]
MTKNQKPVLHFTPEQNWMNDPNGLFFYEGVYHLFYQHNPYEKTWGHMSWGHAISHDLVKWQHLPIAIREEPANSMTIFSGSAVVDVNNTSGFSKSAISPVVAIYTADHRPDSELQDIRIAYSLDKGVTFSKYIQNPVLNVNNRKFGDPKVFWHETSEKWIMVNILGYEQGQIVFYGSADLKHWQFLSEFKAAHAIPGIWECPDLFPLPVDGDPNQIKWLLKANGPYRASYFFMGEFDGTCFRNELAGNQAVEFDFGNLYAEVTWNNIPQSDGRRILIGWIDNKASPLRDWTGIQSIPRQLELRSHTTGLKLHQIPVIELQQVRQQSYSLEEAQLSHYSINLAEHDLLNGALEIIAEVDPGMATHAGFKFTSDADGTREMSLNFNFAGNELTLQVDKQPDMKAPVALGRQKIVVRMFIDLEVIEFFINDGETALASLLPPDFAPESIEFIRSNNTAKLLRMTVWRLALNAGD